MRDAGELSEESENEKDWSIKGRVFVRVCCVLVRVCACVKKIKVKTSGKSVSFLTGFLILHIVLLL